LLFGLHHVHDSGLLLAHMILNIFPFLFGKHDIDHTVKHVSPCTDWVHVLAIKGACGDHALLQKSISLRRYWFTCNYVLNFKYLNCCTIQ